VDSRRPEAGRSSADSAGRSPPGFNPSLIIPLRPQVLRIESDTTAINYSLNKVRFTSSVPAGGSVRLNAKQHEELPGGGVQVTIGADRHPGHPGPPRRRGVEAPDLMLTETLAEGAVFQPGEASGGGGGSQGGGGGASGAGWLIGGSGDGATRGVVGGGATRRCVGAGLTGGAVGGGTSGGAVGGGATGGAVGGAATGGAVGGGATKEAGGGGATGEVVGVGGT
jgi:hypothetical protein